MTYTPDHDKLVRERVLAYLKSIDGVARPAEIADAVEASQSHIYEVLSNLNADGLVVRKELDRIIGHPMPDGGSEVLPADREKLLEIVARYDPSFLDHAKDLSTPNIRSLIESEIAVGDPYPLGTKVAYGIAEA